MSTTKSFYNHSLSHQSTVNSAWIKIPWIWFDWLKTRVAWHGWRWKSLSQDPRCFPHVTNFNEKKNECWKRLSKQLMKHTVPYSDILDQAVLPLQPLTEITIPGRQSTAAINGGDHMANPTCPYHNHYTRLPSDFHRNSFHSNCGWSLLIQSSLWLRENAASSFSKFGQWMWKFSDSVHFDNFPLFLVGQNHSPGRTGG